MALKAFYKKKEKYINRSPPWSLAIYATARLDAASGAMAAYLAGCAPPLFPLTFIAFLGGKPTNLLPVPVQYRVGFVLTRYACSRGARASRCVFIVGETRRKTRAACTGKKKYPQVALLAGIRLRSMRASLAPLPEPRVDAPSSVSARAFTHVSSIVEAFFGKATKNLCEKNGKGVNNTVQFLGCCYKKRFDIIDLFKRSIDVIFLYFSNFDHFLKRDCEIAV